MKIKILFLGIVFLISGYAQAQRATDEKPNFLFIFSDDQRYDMT